MNSQQRVKIALAPKGWTSQMVVESLRWDPFQSRVSMNPIFLQNPKTLVKKPLSEYVEDIIGDERFAIETEEDLVFVGMATNSAFGRVFIPIAVANKRILISRGPDAAIIDVDAKFPGRENER